MRYHIMAITLLAAGTAAIDPSSTPLQEWPIIMAHDAATTYLDGSGLHEVNKWAKTQADGGLGGILTCGGRAFDFRPGPKDGDTVYAHHGDVTIKKNVSEMFDEVVQWAAKNKNGADDLVVIGITDASGVVDDVKAILDAHEIKYYSNCADLKNMTAAAATEAALLPGGGSVMAIFDCWEEHYDPSVTCSGFGDGHIEYTCYKDSNTKDLPLNRMYSYIDGVVTGGPPTDGSLYTVQALWQEDTDSVIVGTLHGSSLIGDEQKSGLNALLAQRIASGEINGTRIGMFEVNDVCDSAVELVTALRNLH